MKIKENARQVKKISLSNRKTALFDFLLPEINRTFIIKVVAKRLLKFYRIKGGVYFMADENKCAHEACRCAVGEDEEYCSPQCEAADEGEVTGIACECGHSGCV